MTLPELGLWLLAAIAAWLVAAFLWGFVTPQVAVFRRLSERGPLDAETARYLFAVAMTTVMFLSGLCGVVLLLCEPLGLVRLAVALPVASAFGVCAFVVFRRCRSRMRDSIERGGFGPWH